MARPTEDELRRRIAVLEAQLGARAPFGSTDAPTVIVPDELKPQFDQAQATVAEYFRNVAADPSRGIIEIGGQRYVLVRASALAFGFLDSIRQVYRDRGEVEAQGISRAFLYDIAHSIGTHDARDFHHRMSLSDPIEKLAAGPVHFAYTGWALVKIWEGSMPVPNDDYVITYDHPYSFEADSWLRAGRHTDSPVCIMNGGYSSGWCEQSFGVELTAVEIHCRAKGDPQCTFIMAPPWRIAERIRERFGDVEVAGRGIEIPTYFQRIKTEELRSRFIEQVILAQDEERRHIARELHDELGSMLTSLGMGLRGVELSEDLPSAREQARALQDVAQVGLDALRRLSRGLHPSVLDDLGFVAAMEQYIKGFAATHAVEVHLETVTLGQGELPHSLSIALYRIIQESLTNAVRHGEPERISVVVAREGKQLRLVIDDDGRGLAAGTQDPREAGGLGLQAITERVTLLKGTVAFEATPGGGFTVAIQVPLNPAAVAASRR